LAKKKRRRRERKMPKRKKRQVRDYMPERNTGIRNSTAEAHIFVAPNLLPFCCMWVNHKKNRKLKFPRKNWLMSAKRSLKPNCIIL